ncbi:hypothetical protein ABEB36_003799 [Hypothenemus hampei]|uniref:Uncharacterized protein n=1 Tax=Hypothenemus hampei TaxID=57062 RepID=A0ABD1F2H0_HYPHA
MDLPRKAFRVYEICGSDTLTTFSSLGEKGDIVLIYGAENHCARRTAATFNERDPNKMSFHRYVLNLIAKFTETGSVGNMKQNRPRVLNKVAQIGVSDHFGVNPNTSCARFLLLLEFP